MDKSVLTFWGSDSGFGKKNNCAYVEYNNKLLLIDCGFTVFHEIQKNIDIKKYDRKYVRDLVGEEFYIV